MTRLQITETMKIMDINICTNDIIHVTIKNVENFVN